MSETQYKDGSSYEGQRNAEGHRNGLGRLKYSNGTLYTELFANGLQHGLGVMIIPDTTNPPLKHTYEGDFIGGNFSGLGVFTRSDGMKYEGEFKDGNISGYGLVTFKDGSHGIPRQEGQFKEGSLVESRQCTTQCENARKKAVDAKSQAISFKS